jgi:GH25 family lysozyme M1 (1,4-beta-N-acetylmuramidase)
MPPPPNSLPGIDVSHWQSTIDWPSVAASGKRFAFMKATEGRTFDDPTYASNRAGAVAAGLIVTAYHFAKPDATAGDAVIEADHFVSVAQIDSGNIIPVLDLEKAGGLNPSKLTAWVLAWLQEVAARTGVKPMIYSGPNFWRTNMGDTQAIADAGYRMWVANWDVSQPDVPGNDWGGQGWTFWQWTDCEHVPGISGCVDSDWYNGTDLGPVTIRRLTVSLNAPNGTVASSPAGITCGATCTALFDPGATVTLTPTPNPGAVFVGWSGACSGTGPCTVAMTADQSVTATFGFTLTTSLAGAGTGTVTSSPAGIVCGSAGSACSAAFPTATVVTLTAAADTGMEFSDWSGDCTGTGACAVTMDAARAVTATFIDAIPPTATIAVPAQLTGPVTITFSEIVHQVTATNVVLRAEGSSSNVPVTFTCTSPKGAEVDCSTGNVVTVVARPSAPLVPGQHYTATVDPADASSPVVDRGGNAAPMTSQDFTAATLVEQTNPAVLLQWRSVANRSAFGGSYTAEHLPGAKASFTFTGNTITWYTVMGPSQGRASVSIDGRFRGVFDDYAPSFQFRVPRTFNRLGPGTHTIAIVPQGRKAVPAATDMQVAVDAFRVGQKLYATPVLATTWHAVRVQGASGGSFAEADLPGSSVSLRFRGTAVDWYTVTGPSEGRAKIYLDGKLVKTVDEYSPHVAYGVKRHIGGLADAVHTLRIVVLGQARRAATGAFVAVDRFVVG